MGFMKDSVYYNDSIIIISNDNFISVHKGHLYVLYVSRAFLHNILIILCRPV